MPAMCPIGFGHRNTSDGPPPEESTMARHSARSVLCEWTTPFGSAVVPLVYASTCGSSGEISGAGNSSVPRPSRSAHAMQPSGTLSPTTITCSREGSSSRISASMAR